MNLGASVFWANVSPLKTGPCGPQPRASGPGSSAPQLGQKTSFQEQTHPPPLAKN